jgi:hypothetical protein
MEDFPMNTKILLACSAIAFGLLCGTVEPTFASAPISCSLPDVGPQFLLDVVTGKTRIREDETFLRFRFLLEEIAKATNEQPGPQRPGVITNKMLVWQKLHVPSTWVPDGQAVLQFNPRHEVKEITIWQIAEAIYRITENRHGLDLWNELSGVRAEIAKTPCYSK